jgi:hypothetical protein
MRKNLPPEIERQRLSSRYGGIPGSGSNGCFLLLCPVTGCTLRVIVSNGRDWQQAGMPGEPWEHVSISKEFGILSTYLERKWVRETFWEDEETVIEFWPPKSKFVNINPGVLHLWRPTETVIPMPPERCV